MVSKLTNAFSLTGSGLRDWMVQRVTSIILAAYILFLIGYLFFHPRVDYFTWQLFMTSAEMRVFSLLALISLILHAWIGVWTIATDYIKPLAARLIFQSAVIIALVVYLICGMQILWRV